MSKMQDIQDWLRKYLFWCLCGSIALFSLAAWWFGVGTLTTKATANKAEIVKNFKVATEVTQRQVIGLHPNDAVNKQVSTLTLGTRNTVLKAWEDLYRRQKDTIYKWPALLDKNFQAWIKENPWHTEIPFDQLDEYQNKVLKELERIVTTVANAEWPDNAAAAATNKSSLSGSTRGLGEMPASGAADSTLASTGVPGVSEKLLWDPLDITGYKNRYKWALRPTTSEVRLAQEDLWVLEQLCRVISSVNGQIPPYQRPIKVVKRIAIEGYALDGRFNGQPHGINSKRILRAAPAATPAAATGEAGEPAAAADGAAVEGAPAVSAPPSRLGSGFSGGPGGGGGGGGENASVGGEAAAVEGAPVKKPEDELYDWRYIDQKGYPLSKAQLDGEHKNDLVRMVPFKIQMHIVQSALPKLLEAFKDAPLILEVTQLRINAENNAANQFANVSKTTLGDGGSSQGHGAGPAAGLLTGEIVLEIQGTAYLAQPFDEKKLPPPDGAAPDAT